jgi:hypothetical protein
VHGKRNDIFIKVSRIQIHCIQPIIREQNQIGVAVDQFQIIFDGKVGGELKINDKAFYLSKEIKAY